MAGRATGKSRVTQKVLSCSEVCRIKEENNRRDTRGSGRERSGGGRREREKERKQEE